MYLKFVIEENLLPGHKAWVLLSLNVRLKSILDGQPNGYTLSIFLPYSSKVAHGF